MAVALDTTTEFSSSLGNIGGANPATATWSHTCTGSNLVLIVLLGIQGGASANFLGVTYNTVTMTQLTTQGDIAVYYLFNPPTGAHNIVASFNDSGSLPIAAMAGSYTGVNPSFDSFHPSTGASSSTFAASTTVVAANCWTLAIASTASVNTQLGVGSGTTKRQVVFNNGNTASYIFGDSNGTVGTGSQNLNFTAGAASTWNGIMLSLAPLSAIVNSNFLMFM